MAAAGKWPHADGAAGMLDGQHVDTILIFRNTILIETPYLCRIKDTVIKELSESTRAGWAGQSWLFGTRK
jgi:hypothetical protein